MRFLTKKFEMINLLLS